jgi:hypothetical protein
MTIKGIYPEKRTVDGGSVDSIKVELDMNLAKLDIPAEYADYTEVLECWMTLYKKPVNVEQAIQEAVAEKEALLVELAGALPDELATQYANLYPELMGDGEAVTAGQRRRFQEELYKANVTLWDRPDQWPDAEPSLWTKITQSGGVEDWIQPTGAHDAYNTGDHVMFEGKHYVSLIDGNVWSPAAYPAGWSEV